MFHQYKPAHEDSSIEIELPLIPALVDMQTNGIIVDTDELRRMSDRISQELGSVEDEVYGDAGERFNINSPQQMGNILFEKLLPPARLRELELPAPKRTKTGYSTDASVLETLKDASPVAAKVLRYRGLSKLKSTYLDALPTLVNPKTGRVHTSYYQVGSATGRFSSSDPNLQNIPIRTELDKQVRRAFKAEPARSLIAADYSRIELRILAPFVPGPGSAGRVLPRRGYPASGSLSRRPNSRPGRDAI